MPVGSHSNGYEGAVIDATDPSQPGPSAVLARLEEGIKDRQRQVHLKAALVQHLGPTDWVTRCLMASILLDRLRPWAPLLLEKCTAEQLADDLIELLGMVRNVEAAQPSAEDISRPGSEMTIGA